MGQNECAQDLTDCLRIRIDKSQEDGSKCSIFSFDANANRSRLPLAKNALRKFRTLRHPGIIRVLDTVEVGVYVRLVQQYMRLLEDKVDRPMDLHCD